MEDVEDEIELAVVRVRVAAARIPAAHERPRLSVPATGAAVAGLVAAIGGPLPGDLRRLLAFHDEIVAMNVHNGMAVGGARIIARNVTRGDAPRTASVDGADVEVIPIGSDGGGNQFLLGLRDARVWRWDHETGATVVMAHSLGRFLERIAQDFDHWAADDRTWLFLT